MSIQPTVVLGTHNKKKIEELHNLFRDLPLTITDLTAFPHAPEIVEDGGTFEANGRKKAVGLAKALGQWVLSDDSGLVVPAIKGEPGVDSALYSGKHGADEANNHKLLKRLENVPDELRGAYYVCVLVLANPRGEVVAVTEGRCHGRIVRERCGVGGFGYDPLFLVPEYHRTFGELSLVVKQALSHRAQGGGVDAECRANDPPMNEVCHCFGTPKQCVDHCGFELPRSTEAVARS